MLPDISIDKIKKELDGIKAQERAIVDKALLDKSQMDRLKQGARLMEKHPS